MIEVMRAALVQMDQKLKGFALPDAVLTAPETRSSSPVRILRDEFLQSNLRGLYPCGEGGWVCGRHCVGGGGWYPLRGDGAAG